jgi:mRNA interferase HigB
MHVITRTALVTFWTKHPEAERPLRAWFQITRTAHWSHFAELKSAFRSADQVGRFVVFDIGGNRFRLIAYVDYEYKKLFVRRVLTHAEYGRGDWKNDPWF